MTVRLILCLVWTSGGLGGCYARVVRGVLLAILGATVAMLLFVLAAWWHMSAATQLDIGPLFERCLDPWTVPEDAGDLVVQPGGRGFIDALRTGPHRHRYDECANRTTILDEVWLGRRSFRFPVASYDGRPSRDVDPAKIRRLEIPYAFLFVRRGSHPTEGRVVKPGRTLIDGKWEVSLAPGEMLWVTVSRDGIRVDDREAP